MAPPADTVLLDVGGTLVNSTHLRAQARVRALRSIGRRSALLRVHHATGLSGVTLVPPVLDDGAEKEVGDMLRATWEEGDGLGHEIVPVPWATDLVGRTWGPTTASEEP